MAMAMAVTEPNLSETNVDFLRPNAVLAVIIVTDAVEQSPNSVGSYLAILRAAKGNRTELVSVSVVGPFSPHSATCITEGLVDSGRYVSAITATGGVQADICTSSWSTDLENISRNVFGARRRFELSSAARSPPEITVTVGGNPNTAWQYEPATNAVLFDSTPAPGAQITIRYRTACF